MKKAARSRKSKPAHAPRSKPKRSRLKPVRAKETARSAAPKSAPTSGLAARMAAFSQKVIKEEERPVAVRSFTEARAGSEGSTVLTPKTGEVEPRMQPMTGQQAVPRRSESPEFAAGRPRKMRVETPDSFGPIELRQATASGGRHITRAKAENLQRGASRIGALASPGAEERRGGSRKDDEFEVARPRPEAAVLPDALTDMGDVEIEQQTLSGSRRVGRLAKSEKEEDKDES